jgi:ATP-dependent DNA ligase
LSRLPYSGFPPLSNPSERPDNGRRPPGDGATIYKHAYALGCEGIVSKRLGSPYRPGRSDHWLKIKNPLAPAARREAEEEWQ